jgi:hypothetical protein
MSTERKGNTMDTVAAGTLQAEVNQRMSPFFIDAPGGEVEVRCQGSDFHVEMRGYRDDRWVGAGVTVYLPEFRGYASRDNEVQEAKINHSSCSSHAREGDVEVTIELLTIAKELRDRLNDEAEVALAPIRKYFEQREAEMEAERASREKLREEQRKVLAQVTADGTIRVFVKGRKNPVKVTYTSGDQVCSVKTQKLIAISQIERVEYRPDVLTGTYVPVKFPVI